MASKSFKSQAQNSSTKAKTTTNTDDTGNSSDAGDNVSSHTKQDAWNAPQANSGAYINDYWTTTTNIVPNKSPVVEANSTAWHHESGDPANSSAKDNNPAQTQQTEQNHSAESHEHATGHDEHSSEENQNTPADNTAPVLVTETTLDNKTGVSLTDNLSVTFSENIQLGSGAIELHKVSDNSLVESFKNGVGSEGGVLSISKSQLMLNPFADLTPDTHYYLTFSDGVIKDLAGNHLQAISAPDMLDFTTPGLDTQAPILLPLADQPPLDTSTHVMSLRFNENVQPGSGAIELHKASDQSLVQSFGSKSSWVNGSEISLQLNQDVLPATQYYLTIANDAVHDTAGNSFAGIADSATLGFTTPAPDLQAPVPSSIALQNPMSLASDLTLTFNENVLLGAGDIILHKASDGSVVETFNNGIGSIGGYASASKSTVNINPGADLTLDTQYYLTMSNDVITDTAGNAYAGTVDANTLSFSSPGANQQAPALLGTYASPILDGKLPATVVTLNFNADVKLGAGDIVLHHAEGSVVETFSYGIGSADGYISAMYGSLNIFTYVNLTAGANYYLTIADNAITDKAGNVFAEVTNPASTQFTQQQAYMDPATQDFAYMGSWLDNQIGAPVASDIALNFNHDVTLGNGTIVLHNADDGTEVETFTNGAGSVGGSVTASKSSVTVNPAADLAPATQYYLTVKNGAISDTSGAVFKGFSDTDTLNFFTADADKLAPHLTGSSPEDNRHSAPVDAQIMLYFDESVQFGKGAIELRKISDNSVVESFTQGKGSAGGSSIASYGSITLNPAVNLERDTQYYLSVANNAITDTSGNAFAGISDPATLNFTSMGPDLQEPSPYYADLQNLPVNSDLALNFDKDVKLSTGEIALHKASDGSVIETFTNNGIGSMGGQISVDNSPGIHAVLINPYADLFQETQYYLTIAENAITDTSGNSFAGFSDPSALSFTTFTPGPVFYDLYPMYGAPASDLVLSFSDMVQPGAGEIALHKFSDDSVVETFTNGVSAAGGSVLSAGNFITINPFTDLSADTQYYLTITKGAITDMAGTAYMGSTDKNVITFTTMPSDITAPELSWSSPVDNQTHIATDTDFTLAFNESVHLSAGSIELHKASDGSVVEIFVHGAGSAGGSIITSYLYGDTSLAINPANDLQLSTQYYFTVSNDAITDLSANAYSGVSDPYSLNFKTTSDPGMVSMITSMQNIVEEPPMPDGGIDLVGVHDMPTMMF